MANQSKLGVVLAVTMLAALPSLTVGQDLEQVEHDALQCWRRVEKNAVHVGERFGMTITCAIVETDEAKATPDFGWFEAETLAVSPFEILTGDRYRDVVRGARRFFQYHYVLRIIGEDYFGLDVELPAVELKYRIARTLDSELLVEGRELTYILPAESVRVLTLVPESVTDIRELSGETFGDTEGRLFRANASAIIAAVCGFLSLVMLLAAAAQLWKQWRMTSVVTEIEVSRWRSLRAILDEMRNVQHASQSSGWTPALVSRTLVSMRVGGAISVDQPITCVPAGDSGSQRELATRLYVPPPLLGRGGGFVSSSVTGRTLENALSEMKVDRPNEVVFVEAIRDGLERFTTERYGSATGQIADSLDPYVVRFINTIEVFRRQAFPPVHMVVELKKSFQRRLRELWKR